MREDSAVAGSAVVADSADSADSAAPAALAALAARNSAASAVRDPAASVGGDPLDALFADPVRLAERFTPVAFRRPEHSKKRRTTADDPATDVTVQAFGAKVVCAAFTLLEGRRKAFSRALAAACGWGRGVR